MILSISGCDHMRELERLKEKEKDHSRKLLTL